MASRNPPSRKKRAPGAKPAKRKPARAESATTDPMPTLAELKRARAKLDAALDAMDRKRRK